MGAAFTKVGRSLASSFADHASTHQELYPLTSSCYYFYCSIVDLILTLDSKIKLRENVIS